ncbi:MAG: PHP domain-containing protein [Chloroflexota bacterium]|nr:PHP domain-containing protein [Chloroflexota bacterium]
MRSGLADVHLHTLASDGLMSARELVEYVERHTDLDVIAVTDHDETSASLEAREWAATHNYRVQVVPGVEVTTRDGHLLGLFVEERPPALRPLQPTAEWVLAHGGVCVAPHPFSRWTHSLNLRALGQAATLGLVAGVEVLNASLAGRSSRPPAVRFVREYGLAGLGASDAHMVSMVGLARTRFAGRTPEDLRRAIQAAATSPEGRFATSAEMASEAIPQLARSMIHLPLRRIVRYARARRLVALRAE